jgi:hypothetical protein
MATSTQARDEALVVDRVGRSSEGVAHEAVGGHRLDHDQRERVQIGRRDAGGGEARGQPGDDLLIGARHQARVELVEQRGRQAVCVAPHDLG